jgi:ubiquinone/menaquinone biosynthesis C-methylase UbiE
MSKKRKVSAYNEIYIKKTFNKPWLKELKEARYNWLWSLFKNKKRILDIGCGIGQFMEFDPKRSVGVDINTAAVKICKKKGLNVKVADMQSLPFKKNSFDGIFSSHTIEHFISPVEVMNEIRRVLKKGGRLVLLTPNYPKYKRFWDAWTHMKPYTKIGIQNMVETFGFKVIHLYTPARIPGMGRLCRLLRKPSYALKIANFVGSIIGGDEIILVAEKIS